MAALFTLQMLIDAKACSKQVALFRETFGDSVNVTVAKARKVAGEFDWDFARRFLDAPAQAAYLAATAPAQAAYDAAKAPAQAAYDAAKAEAWAAYLAAMAEAWAAYDAATAPARAAYDAAKAEAWARAYIATVASREAAQVPA
jgi:chromosome segregation protein